MAVASACFKWADVLENQFDKSWVELDTILCQLEDDEVGNHEIILIAFNSDLVQDFGMPHLQSTSSSQSSLLFAGLWYAAPAGQESRLLARLLLLTVRPQVDHSLPGCVVFRLVICLSQIFPWSTYNQADSLFAGFVNCFLIHFCEFSDKRQVGGRAGPLARGADRGSRVERSC